MYGKKRYGRVNKPIEQPVDNSIPTFFCEHCKQIKTINMPHIEITALDNGKLFMYTKMCKGCSELLVKWMRA
jgi:hypothetical protein